MKKLILFLLIGALLILPLSGCFADNKQNEGTTPNNTTENTTPENTKEYYNPLPDETIPEQPHGPDHPTDPNAELIEVLVIYLEQYLTQYDLKGKSLFEKIDDIKGGIQPLHVVFNPNDYYYMCGYYTPTHEYEEYMYCCARGYTWAKYEKETDIPEFYDSQPCMVVFQINKSLSVTDILSNTADVPAMQHFQIYQPIFENGFNVAEPITFDQSFLYLDYPNCELNGFIDNTIYYSTDFYYHPRSTIPCVRLSNQDYLPFFLYSTKADGTIRETADYTYDFGGYYDTLINVVEKEKYSVTDDLNRTTFYGVIAIEDFVNGVLKQE